MRLSTFDAFKNIHDNELIELDDKTLKKLQKELLSIAIDLKKECEKNNIEFFLGGGSCLGAVRHNGFIPWDDDVDINITRENYNKFIANMSDKFKNKYWIHTPENTKNYGLGFAKIRKKGTIYKTRDDFENEECGISIDLFIVENTYNNIILRYIHGLLSMFIGFLYSCIRMKHYKKYYAKLLKNNKSFKIKCFIGTIFSFISLDAITHVWNNINKMCKNNNSKYVTIPVGRKHFFKEMYVREKYCKYIEHSFENTKFLISNDYDYYLNRLYGEYMIIPKSDNREKHIIYDIKF